MLAGLMHAPVSGAVEGLHRRVERCQAWRFRVEHWNLGLVVADQTLDIKRLVSVGSVFPCEPYAGGCALGSAIRSGLCR